LHRRRPGGCPGSDLLADERGSANIFLSPLPVDKSGSRFRLTRVVRSLSKSQIGNRKSQILVGVAPKKPVNYFVRALPPSLSKRNLLPAESLAALRHNEAFLLTGKILHTGIFSGGGFDRFGLAAPAELDTITLGRTFKGLLAVQVGDLDRVFIALLGDN
jgi:hypothetical protein